MRDLFAYIKKKQYFCSEIIISTIITNIIITLWHTKITSPTRL